MRIFRTETARQTDRALATLRLIAKLDKEAADKQAAERDGISYLLDLQSL